MLVAHELLPQRACLAFHDAGIFNKSANAGGANGCLLNHSPVRLEPEKHLFTPASEHIDGHKERVGPTPINVHQSLVG